MSGISSSVQTSEPISFNKMYTKHVFMVKMWVRGVILKKFKNNPYSDKRNQNQYLFFTIKTTQGIFSNYVKIGFRVLYDLLNNPFPRKLPFIMFLYKQYHLICWSFTLVPKSLTILWLNSHQPCILGQNIYTSK